MQTVSFLSTSVWCLFETCVKFLMTSVALGIVFLLLLVVIALSIRSVASSAAVEVLTVEEF